MSRHLCIVIGQWKLENWRLYRWTPHVAVKNAAVRWNMWDIIL